MQDYLFFKIMRNQINHAKKSNLTSTVKEYFKVLSDEIPDFLYNRAIDKLDDYLLDTLVDINQIL